VIGPRTMGEVYKYSKNKMQSLVLSERLRRYVWLLKEHPEQKKFIRGWIDRVANLLDFTVISDPTMFKK
jgi:lysozyme family protein